MQFIDAKIGQNVRVINDEQNRLFEIGHIVNINGSEISVEFSDNAVLMFYDEEIELVDGFGLSCADFMRIVRERIDELEYVETEIDDYEDNEIDDAERELAKRWEHLKVFVNDYPMVGKFLHLKAYYTSYFDTKVEVDVYLRVEKMYDVGGYEFQIQGFGGRVRREKNGDKESVSYHIECGTKLCFSQDWKEVEEISSTEWKASMDNIYNKMLFGSDTESDCSSDSVMDEYGDYCYEQGLKNDNRGAFRSPVVGHVSYGEYIIGKR